MTPPRPPDSPRSRPRLPVSSSGNPTSHAELGPAPGHCCPPGCIGGSYSADWEPAAPSGRRVLGVFWRCLPALWGPSTPNPTLVAGENLIVKNWPIFFLRRMDMWWISPMWPKCAFGDQRVLIRKKGMPFGDPPYQTRAYTCVQTCSQTCAQTCAHTYTCRSARLAVPQISAKERREMGASLCCMSVDVQRASGCQDASAPGFSPGVIQVLSLHAVLA